MPRKYITNVFRYSLMTTLKYFWFRSN